MVTSIGFSLPEGICFGQTSSPSIDQHALFCHIQALLYGNDMSPEIESQHVDDGFPAIFNDLKILNGLLFAASCSLNDDTYNIDGLHVCTADAKNNAAILSQSQMLKAHNKNNLLVHKLERSTDSMIPKFLDTTFKVPYQLKPRS
jgi:hypothetical protein